MKIVSTNSINKIEKQINLEHTHSSNFQKSHDAVSFTGILVRPVKDKTEIKELVNLFYDTLKSNIAPNSKSFKFIEKIERYICTMPFVASALKPCNITEIVKSGNKLAGGYSMTLNNTASTAHIGFITLAPEFMRTRTGIKTLKMIGQRICQNLELNNIKELTWSTNSRNKPINRLLKRFNAEKVRQVYSETEYKISVDKLKSKLENLELNQL